jgi:aminoglycoside phosphotransferase (APT) family kinase protein
MTAEAADLASDLATVLGTGVADLRRLSGGASRETWAFDALDGDARRPLVVQRQRPWQSVVAKSGMATEARLMGLARAAGVPVPAVVVTAAEVGETLPALGPAWVVVERLDGETLARRILRDDAYAAARPRLAGQCGTALAGIHAVDPDLVPDLVGAESPARYRDILDSLGEPHPAFELGFRWLEANRPPAGPETVVHGDFRNGNLIVGPEGLVAVLDWELAHRGDPLEDLGWLCVKAWRFGAAPRVGGFGTVDDLVAAYEVASGRAVDRAALAWWETFGTLKWGIMCMVQASKHLSGDERSVELAAIGRRVCEQEHDLLLLLP